MSFYRLKTKASPFAPEDHDIEKNDPSLNGQSLPSFSKEYHINEEDLRQIFLAKYGIEYIVDYFEKSHDECRIVTHPKKTNTCYEKAELLGDWSPLNVIKALYFENPDTGALYAIVTPETGCFIDRSQVIGALRLPQDTNLKKSAHLPHGMHFGTCSPFIIESDASCNGGRVKKILFDRETLVLKRHERTLDDFSYGLDHRFSIQMNYYDCYDMLKRKFRDLIADEDILTLLFKESFVRNRGRIKITYDFNSLSYRISSFINSIHGNGDISIVDDHVDELDLPDVLSQPKRHE
ncbi:MAG TPA: hypothetical protein VEI57_15845 [Nitrospirota bacterium]|nr:hypothetical protein [Nitrospirota bacterium]